MDPHLLEAPAAPFTPATLNLTLRLRLRATVAAPPSAAANAARSLADALPPTGAAVSLELPPGAVAARVTPSAGLLLVFGPGHGDVEAWHATGVQRCERDESGAPPPPSAPLAAAARRAWRARPCPPGEALSRDCVLEAGEGRFLILASSTPPGPPPRPRALPRVATTRVLALRASDGAHTGTAVIPNDFVALAGAGGVAVDGCLVAVACAASASAAVFRLDPATGALLPAARIGPHVFWDDGLALDTAGDAEAAWRAARGPPRGERAAAAAAARAAAAAAAAARSPARPPPLRAADAVDLLADAGGGGAAAAAAASAALVPLTSPPPPPRPPALAAVSLAAELNRPTPPLGGLEQRILAAAWRRAGGAGAGDVGDDAPPRPPPPAAAASFFRDFDETASLTIWRAAPLGGDHLLLLLAPPDAPPPPPLAAPPAARPPPGPSTRVAVLDVSTGRFAWFGAACGDGWDEVKEGERTMEEATLTRSQNTSHHYPVPPF
jgi:hypothetical protein